MPLKLSVNGATKAIAATLALGVAAGGLLWRVNDVAAEQEVTEKRLKCVEENQKVLDRNQREMTADSAWMLEGVHALLDAADVPRTKRPDVKESKMKETD